MASLKSLLESSLQSYLVGAVGGNVYKGHDDSDKAAPCVICAVESMEEEPLQSGNYQATCRITVKSAAKEGEDQLNNLDEDVRNALWTDTIHTDLQTTDLTVFGVAAAHRIDYGIEADMLTASHVLVVYCCNYEFPA